MRVLGLLSGTSHDGIDVTVVDFDERDGMLRGTVLYADRCRMHRNCAPVW